MQKLSTMPTCRAAMPTRTRALGNDSVQKHLPWMNTRKDQESATETKSKNAVVQNEQNNATVRATAAERRRARRESSRAVLGDEKLREHHTKAFFDEERLYPNYGGFSDGNMQWYALWCGTKREAAVGKELVTGIRMLPPIALSGGRPVPRDAEAWVPTKKMRKWSTRSQKVTTQTLKYGDGNGGWLFIRCVMDNDVYAVIESHRAIRGYRVESRVEVHDGLGTVRVIPKPLSDDFIASVEAWVEQTEEEVDEAEALKEIYGAGAGPLSSASEKIDDDAEHVEFIDTGKKVMKRGKEVAVMEKRYKTDDYSGSFENPSNWYQGDALDADRAGGRAAGASASPAGTDDWFTGDFAGDDGATGTGSAPEDLPADDWWGDGLPAAKRGSQNKTDAAGEDSWIAGTATGGSADSDWWDDDAGTGAGWLWHDVPRDAARSESGPAAAQEAKAPAQDTAFKAKGADDFFDDHDVADNAWGAGAVGSAGQSARGAGGGAAGDGVESAWASADVAAGSLTTWSDDDFSGSRDEDATQQEEDPATDGFVWQSGGDERGSADARRSQRGEGVRAAEGTAAPGLQSGGGEAQFRVGDSIRVRDGSFAEFEGVVLEVSDSGQITAELDLFNRPTEVTLSPDSIEKL